MKLLLCPLTLLLLCSCMAAGGRRDSWAVVAVGTDASRLTVGQDGVGVDALVQSRGLESARRHLRTAAMVGMGVEAIGAAPSLLREAIR